MSDQSPPVPASLLKLEHLRIRSDLHFAPKSALSERRKELNDQRKYIRNEMATAAESYSGSQPQSGIGRRTSPGGKTLNSQRHETLAELQR